MQDTTPSQIHQTIPVVRIDAHIESFEMKRAILQYLLCVIPALLVGLSLTTPS